MYLFEDNKVEFVSRSMWSQCSSQHNLLPGLLLIAMIKKDKSCRASLLRLQALISPEGLRQEVEGLVRKVFMVRPKKNLFEYHILRCYLTYDLTSIDKRKTFSKIFFQHFF